MDELTAAPDLSAALQQALDSSDFLIVVCSPHAAKSQWVGYEIEAFRARHGDGHILAALKDGTPNEALHPAMRLNAENGHVLQPLAADFRKNGDGQHLALLKLIAALAGVGLGDLVERDAKRRMHQWILRATVLSLVLMIVTLLTVLTLRASHNAVRESVRSGELSGFMLDKLRTDLKRYGDLGMLNGLNRGVLATFVGRDLAELSDAELQQLAKLRLAMGEDAEKRGELEEARREIEEARRITGKRLAAGPNDPKRIFDYAQSQYYIGLVNWNAGKSSAAEAAFQNYRSLADRLIAADPKNPDWWMEKGYAEQNLGMQALRATLDDARAERNFRVALNAFRAVTRLRPNDRDAESAIADVDAWLGDTLRLKGDYNGALTFRREQRRSLEAMRSRDPRDRVVQTDLASNALGFARIFAAQKQWDAALATLDRGRAAALRMAENDPQNVKLAAQVRIFDLFTLRTWLGMPHRPTAERLAAMNGDCEHDRIALKNSELARFCTILAARRLEKTPPASAIGVASSNALTETWGLDLRSEASGKEVRERNMK